MRRCWSEGFRPGTACLLFVGDAIAGDLRCEANTTSPIPPDLFNLASSNLHHGKVTLACTGTVSRCGLVHR
jgi:hypothetical protein